MNEPELPGTQTEIERIQTSFGTTTKEPVTVLTRSAASEDLFKRFALGKRILHLATHGFYSTANCESNEKRAIPSLQNPLLSSGLLLAGCNLLGKVSDTLGLEDGVLSALEVSAMNLRGVQLVVLSACESGLGELKTGEGIWGLRRAFQMAGARTVVSALWPIDDRISANIMSKVYASNTARVSASLRDAQLEELHKLRTAGLPDHPFLWAGFVAQGGD
jgi:CHAT domain-containing protein